MLGRVALVILVLIGAVAVLAAVAPELLNGAVVALQRLLAWVQGVSAPPGGTT